MPKETPRQRAEALLRIHNGSCFVHSKSDLVQTFQTMEEEGLVVTRPEIHRIPGLSVKAKGWIAHPTE